MNEKGVVLRKLSRCTTETDQQGVSVDKGDVSYLFAASSYYFREVSAARDGAALAAHWVCQAHDGIWCMAGGTCHRT